jgi:hexulose-6-phosphate isomerase
VELGVRGDSYPGTELWSADGIAALSNRSRSAGVEIASICLHTFWTFSFADPDAAHRSTARNIVLQALGAAKELGARAILIPVTNPAQLPPEQAHAYWVEEMKAVSREAREAGVTLALELVGRSHAKTGQDILTLIEAVGSPGVGAYLDWGNSLSLGGDPLRDIRLLGSRIAQVHVKDPGGTLLGQGKVDMKACVEALKAVGYRGYFVLETPATDDPDAAARHNLRYLRDLLGE